MGGTKSLHHRLKLGRRFVGWNFFIRLLLWYIAHCNGYFSFDGYVSILLTLRIHIYSIVSWVSCTHYGFLFIRLLRLYLAHLKDSFSFNCYVSILHTLRILCHSIVTLVSRALFLDFFSFDPLRYWVSWALLNFYYSTVTFLCLINYVVIQRFLALRKAVTSQVKKYVNILLVFDIADQLLIRHSPFVSLCDVDEWMAKPSLQGRSLKFSWIMAGNTLKKFALKFPRRGRKPRCSKKNRKLLTQWLW